MFVTIFHITSHHITIAIHMQFMIEGSTWVTILLVVCMLPIFIARVMTGALDVSALIEDPTSSFATLSGRAS